MEKTDKKLTAEERELYKQKLDVIDCAKQSFHAMGNAIIDIASEKLYRDEYGTWAEFCELRVGLSVTQVKRLVDAAGAMKLLPKAVQEAVPSAKAAIRLASIEPEKAREIVKQLASEGPITERAVLSAVPAPKPEKRKQSVKPIFDEIGYPVPQECRDLWENRGEAIKLHMDADQVWHRLKDAKKSKSGLYNQVDFDLALTAAALVVSHLSNSLLTVVCPECDGKGCDVCRTTGLLPQSVFDSLPNPDEVRAARKQAIKDLAKEAKE